MARPTVFLLALLLVIPPHAFAAGPATVPALSEAAKLRSKNYHRRGWFLVDGNWARSQAKAGAGDLFTLVDDEGVFHLWADPVPTFEAMLKNGRTALIEIDGSQFGWKLSAAGRVWNDTRSAGSQHLLLTAAMDDAFADGKMRLTKVQITPDQQVIQAAVVEGEQAVSVILVLGRDFIECTAGPFNAAPTTLVRSTSGRQLLLDRPTETRRYAVPLLTLVNAGRNPLAPSAADVYRTFPGLPVDPVAAATLKALIPDLAAADPTVRKRARAELRSLSRRGVQAAMAVDTVKLPFSAAEALTTLVRTDSHDGRSPEALRADSGFILDCLSDPDPNVRNEAGKWVGKFTGPSPLRAMRHLATKIKRPLPPT